MKVFDTPDIRNIALVGHGDSGKTCLASALLFASGAVNRMGRIEDGTAVTDFDEEEISRKISLQAALAHLEWNKKKINLVDTPGYAAFIAEAKAGLAVADSALVLVEGVAGLEVMTSKVFDFASSFSLPVMFVVSKLDRERASFDRCLEQIQERFGRAAVPLQLPIGQEQDFCGVVDLIALKAHRYATDGSGKLTVENVPDDLKERAEAARASLVEMVAESDDKLMEAFFEAGELTQDQLVQGLQASILARKIFPVVAASTTHLIGVRSLLDLVVDLLPTPGARGEERATHAADDSELTRPVDASAPVSLFVFKTIADPFAGRLSLFRVRTGTVKSDSSLTNTRGGVSERLGHVSVMQGKHLEQIGELRAGDLGVVAKLKDTKTGDTLADPSDPIRYAPIEFPKPSISFAVVPKSKGDEEKISGALGRLTEEDPVLDVGRDPQTHELLVSGTSQVHVEVAVTKMKKKFGVDAVLKLPKVRYLETVTKKAAGVEGKHKKQSGGRGQFGVCVIDMEPLRRGDGFKFVDKIFGGSIPQNFRPAVQKGIQETAEKGVLAGYPVVDFQVTLTDGKYHTVDSSEMAFKIAGSLAFKEAVKQARPILLEPIMAVEIVAPEDCMGDVMGDLSSRRGKPQGMEAQGDFQLIKAEVPMAEMLTYDSTLKSITSDRGSYHMDFDHYEPAPAQIQEQIIADANKAKEQEA
jgi:elongation factor G